MATLSSTDSFIAKTPKWLVLQSTANPVSFSQELRIAVQCEDGWVNLFTIELNDFTLRTTGCAAVTRRELLERALAHIAPQLATLELEQE
jgi:hypothetical protein